MAVVSDFAFLVQVDVVAVSLAHAHCPANRISSTTNNNNKQQTNKQTNTTNKKQKTTTKRTTKN